MQLSRGLRLGHVNIEVTNLARARKFYDGFLPVLGFAILNTPDPAWLGYRKGPTALWITVSHPHRAIGGPPHVPTDGVEDPISDHIGFRVPSSKQVAEIEQALRRKGFRPVYATEKLPTYGRQWYTSNAWRDPDNNVLEIYSVTKH